MKIYFNRRIFYTVLFDVGFSFYREGAGDGANRSILLNLGWWHVGLLWKVSRKGAAK